MADKAFEKELEELTKLAGVVMRLIRRVKSMVLPDDVSEYMDKKN